MKGPEVGSAPFRADFNMYGKNVYCADNEFQVTMHYSEMH